MAEKKISLQAYAMQLGTYMGLFWIAKFILFPLGLTYNFLLFFFFGLTLCVPFLGFYYVRSFRNQVLQGSISLAQAWVFTVFMYMFAALLTAVAHYLYFRFIDGGFIIDTYAGMLTEFKTLNIEGTEEAIGQLKNGLEQLKTLTPIEITMQLMSQNIFYCSLIAIPTALFVMRRKRIDVTNIEN